MQIEINHNKLKRSPMTEAQQTALTRVLVEASDLVTTRLINNAIVSKGEVTLQEATFFNNLSKEIMFEAAEEFTPTVMDDVDTDINIQDDMILKDDEGNEYMFHPDTGTLEALSVKPEEESNGAIGPEDEVPAPDLESLTSGMIGESSVVQDEINSQVEVITESKATVVAPIPLPMDIIEPFLKKLI